MVKKDTTAPIEGYQGSIKIVEDVECSLVHAKYLSNGNEDKLDEACERGAVGCEPRLTIVEGSSVQGNYQHSLLRTYWVQ